MSKKKKELFCVVFEMKEKDDYEIELVTAKELKEAIKEAARTLMSRIGVGVACVEPCAVVSISIDEVETLVMNMKGGL